MLKVTYFARIYSIFPAAIIDPLTLLYHYKYYMRGKCSTSGESNQSSFNGHFDNSQQTENVSHKTDPYEILGVSKKASQDQIRNAYKSLAAKYHPDKVSHLGEEFRELAEQRFKEIQEAYQKLKVKG